MEELKMIIELVSKVSDDAFIVIILYFMKDILTSILVSGTMIAIVYKAISSILSIMVSNNDYERLMRLLDVHNPFWSCRSGRREAENKAHMLVAFKKEYENK